jgi:hypothetical protein
MGDGASYLLAVSSASVILGVIALLAVFAVAVAFDRSVLRREGHRHRQAGPRVDGERGPR